MKKITLLTLLLLSYALQSQTLTHSASQTIITDNSGACVDFTLGIRDNTYYVNSISTALGFPLIMS